MSKIYLDAKTYDSLYYATLYNQRMISAATALSNMPIPVSDILLVEKIHGSTLSIFIDYDVPKSLSDFMIKYGLKIEGCYKDD